MIIKVPPTTPRVPPAVSKMQDGLPLNRGSDKAATEADVVLTHADVVLVEAAVVEAETARDAAFVNAGVYADVAAGLLAVAPGGQFQVAGDKFITRYRVDAGPVAVAVALYPALAAAVDLAVGLGNVGPAVSQVTGSTTPDSGNSGAAVWSSGRPIEAHGVVSQIAIRTSATMVADLYLVDAGSRVVLAKSASVTFAAGVAVQSYPFGMVVAPPGALVFVGRVSGGFLRYAADAGPCLSVAAASYAIGDTLPAYTPLAAFALAIAVTIETVAQAAATRLGVLTAGRLDEATARGTVTKSRSAAFTPASLGAGSGGNMAKRFLGDGVLTSVQITVPAVSSGVIEHWRVINGAATLLERVAANLASGANTVTVPRWILRGESYICYAPTRGAQASYGTGGIFHYIPILARAIGATAAVSLAAGFSVAIGLTVEAPAGATVHGAVAGRGTLDQQNFASTPADWTITAPFSVSGGLLASGAGGWDKFAGFAKASSIHKRKLSARIVVNDAASVFGLATQTVGGPIIGGGVAMIDGTAGKLRLYSWTGTATAGILAAEVALAALTVGRAYLLVVTINNFAIAATLTDTVTRAVTTVSGTFGFGAVTARMHGRPGFLHISGDVKVEWSHFQIDAPLAQRAVIFGDSNCDGAAVTNPSWSHQLSTTHGGILISARSGEASTDMALRLTDLTILRPQMAICAHGTNDSVLATWRANVGDFVDACRDVNAEPILVRPPPKTAATAFITSIDADISAGYFGKLRSIDFLGALSNAGDRVTWNAAYNSGDNLHPNNAGQVVMAAQALVDVPELAG